MAFTEVLWLFGGLQAVATGLVAWLGKLWMERALVRERAELEQAAARQRRDVELELEGVRGTLAATNQRLQAALARVLHGHRLQIEREFAAIETIWPTIVALRSKALALRPILDQVDPNESAEDRKTRRLKEFEVSRAAFGVAVEHNRPFFAEDVYRALVDLHQLVAEEVTDYEYGPDEKTPEARREYWNASKENARQIGEKIERICEAIRVRVFTAQHVAAADDGSVAGR